MRIHGLSLSFGKSKRYLLWIFALFISMGAAHASSVDEQTARTVAHRFLSHHTGFEQLRSTDLQLVYVENSIAPDLTTNTVLYRVFNAGDHGFVMIAGDDVALPVLGYSTESSFPAENLPTNVAKWFEGYKHQLQQVVATTMQALPSVTSEWERLLSNEQMVDRDVLSVAPLMQTLWDQSPNVNALCPGGSVTGCVATAMAQIMKYHNSPATGVGFHSYNAPNYGTLSANFASTTYEWTGMPNTVSGPNNAVATLMFHCGVSVDMQYSPQVSNAYVISAQTPTPNCAEYAFETYFGYNTNLHGEQRDNYTEQNWITMLRADLDASKPIFYGGFGSGGGHAFVCDGYDDNNMFHFNWGWGGQVNGYFQIGALNPGSTGTGGGTGGYNSGQVAILGITPGTGGGGGGGSTTTNTMELYNYVNVSANPLYYGQAFSVSCNIANTGTNGFSGDFGAAVFDAENNFYGFVQTLTGYTLAPNNAYTNDLVFSTTGLFSMVPGTYYIGIYYKPTGGEWAVAANAGAYTNFPQVTVINPSDIELAAAMTIAPGTNLVQGGQISVNLNIQNDGFNNFVGQYGVALYNLDGSFAQEVGTLNETNGLPPGYSYLSPFLTFGPVPVTVPPGTYLVATQHNPSNTGWYLTGSSYFSNPVFVTVTAAGEQPDQYEANNTSATAATLTATFSGNNATVTTSGANMHNGTDQDFYKIVLPAGNNYAITGRLHDSYNSGNGNTYTVDGLWTASADGSNWTDTYDDVGSGPLVLNGGGTVYFHVAPYFAGEVGTYQLQLDIVRGQSVGIDETAATTNITLYPNPVRDNLTIDLSGFDGRLEQVEVLDLLGQQVKLVSVGNKVGGRAVIDLSINTEGAYLLRLVTDKGVRTERIIIAK
ncbi:MAG: thiol protease/hemagglutinin PrtT [Flavobacteriales bacterium]|nr:thiol protease/hemagglutinin PrtT [Flavobacteriales bacterium]MBP6641598.1 thiol protease/hemagglutinin PrtT [Flavobacteriales bacterium]MBP7154721.1 thiol protease/hemagglutinin PrtT [Flavobacteriales bacterium]HQV73979.1 thiol protease/hemagglutinin PrtT [Flavobacteriales bacterium]HQW39648.1 thiol protease/hemagglutinin PrtT [Flavobacteriales bacterium]